MAAKWPTSVATDADLSVAVNSLQTTLSSAIDSAVTTIPLVSTSGFPAVGYVTIDAEVIAYTGVSGGNLTGAVRGADGTVAASHLASAPVGATIVAAHHNSLKDEIKSVQSWLDAVLGKATTVTNTVFNYLVGVTSPIQPQINAIQTTANTAQTTANTANNAVAAIDRLRVTAQGTPGTTVAVASGVYTKSTGSATVTFAGGNSPAFAVVSANSRIDLLTISDTGVLAITQGTQAASPVAPTYPTDKMVLAEVTISQTTGPAITQAMIKDVRPYLNLGTGASAVTLLREDYIVGTALNNYTGSLTVFDLVNTYNVGGNAMMVTLDGDVQTKGASADYLETDADTVTFNAALVAGERISFIWSQTAGAASGAVNPGTANQFSYHATTGASVSGTPTLTTDGSTALTATVPLAMSSQKITGLAAGTAAGDALRFGQTQKIKQITFGTTTTFLNSSSTTFIDTGLSATITPTSVNSKILVIVAQSFVKTGNGTIVVNLDRGGTSLVVIMGAFINSVATTTDSGANSSLVYLDSPASTSALTYKTQGRMRVAGGTMNFNGEGSATTASYMYLIELEP